MFLNGYMFNYCRHDCEKLSRLLCRLFMLRLIVPIDVVYLLLALFVTGFEVL